MEIIDTYSRITCATRLPLRRSQPADPPSHERDAGQRIFRKPVAGNKGIDQPQAGPPRASICRNGTASQITNNLLFAATGLAKDQGGRPCGKAAARPTAIYMKSEASR